MEIEELIDRLGTLLCGAITRQIAESLPELLKKLDASKEAVAAKDIEIASLKSQLQDANYRKSLAEFNQTKAENNSKEKARIANELGKFVCDVANGLYEGQEIAAARRVYDLNSGSLTKQRINACDYDSVQEAKQAYLEKMNDAPYTDEAFQLWLFEPAPQST